MKKSEMIDLLSNKMLELQIGNYYYSKDMYGYDYPVEFTTIELEDIEKIIDFLTESGMLPPSAELSKLNGKDNAWEEED